MIVDIVDKYLTDDNNPIKNLRLKVVDAWFLVQFTTRSLVVMTPRIIDGVESLLNGAGLFSAI
jgi:hypothetical protein